jgi:hypothetical protein
MCCVQVDREEREWCAGLPAHVFAPWVQRLVAQQAPGITAPPLPVRCATEQGLGQTAVPLSPCRSGSVAGQRAGHCQQPFLPGL